MKKRKKETHVVENERKEKRNVVYVKGEKR